MVQYPEVPIRARSAARNADLNSFNILHSVKG